MRHSKLLDADCKRHFIDARGNTYVGCVAVAGAQILYYNHFRSNKPSYFYDDASYNEAWYLNNPRNYYTQSSISTNDNGYWDYMAKNLTDFATYPNAGSFTASFLAQVGYQTNMYYDLYLSKTLTQNLAPVFSSYGLLYNWGDYNVNTIKLNLQSAIPVIIEAWQDKNPDIIFGITLHSNLDNGHTWIVDGYVDKAYRYKYTWERCTGGGGLVPPEAKIKDNNIKNVNNVGSPIISAISNTKISKSFSSTSNSVNTMAILPPDQPSTYITYGATTSQFYWKFNWGYSGIADDGIYYVNDNWQSPNYYLRYSKRIMYNVF